MCEHAGGDVCGEVRFGEGYGASFPALFYFLCLTPLEDGGGGGRWGVWGREREGRKRRGGEGRGMGWGLMRSVCIDGGI